MINKVLRERLIEIDNKSYKLYKTIKGNYNFNLFSLSFVHIQGDPFASPTLVSLRSHIKDWNIRDDDVSSDLRKIAVSDYVLRGVRRFLSIYSSNLGSGKSGLLSIQMPSQKILRRSSVNIEGDKITLYIKIGLPAYGRKISGSNAIKLFENLYSAVEKSMNSMDREKIEKWNETVETYYFIKDEMKKRGLIVFIGNGSVLPRVSGVNDRPLREDVIPFESPKSLEISFSMPSGRIIKGMGIKRGITLITGGGFHGKSTLLKGIESGVYPHIPSDGRELCVTVDDAVKIKSEEGRYVSNTDISIFINHLPSVIDTKHFSTENASGSTSQSSAIVEAMEIGTSLLLIDEDTSATNFMIRDERMQKLIAKEKEPITPFIDRCRELYTKFDISSIIVMGGSGDYLDVADTVLMMDSYRCLDVTDKAKCIVEEYPLIRKKEVDTPIYLPLKRRIKKTFLFRKIKNRDMDYLVLDKEEINLKNIDQIYEEGQIRLIGEMMRLVMNEKDKNIVDVLKRIYKDDIDNMIKKLYRLEVSYIRPQEVFSSIVRCRKLSF